MPDLYGAVAQNAAKRKDASYADFLEEVLKGERDARRVRAREMLTRIAGFPALKTLEAYDFAFAFLLAAVFAFTVAGAVGGFRDLVRAEADVASAQKARAPHVALRDSGGQLAQAGVSK